MTSKFPPKRNRREKKREEKRRRRRGREEEERREEEEVRTSSAMATCGDVSELERKVKEVVVSKVKWDEEVKPGLALDVDALSSSTSSPSHGLVRLLATVLDVLKPRRSRVWRNALITTEGGKSAEQYENLQKAAFNLVATDFVSLLTREDSTTSKKPFYPKETLLRVLTQLVKVGRDVADYIDLAQGQTQTHGSGGGAGGGGGSNGSNGSNGDACVASEFRSFGALNSCWSAASKLIPSLVKQGGWQCPRTLETLDALLKWILDKVHRETLKYVDSGGDKRWFHVLKFWSQTFCKLFILKDSPSQYPLHRPGQQNISSSDAALVLFRTCVRIIETMEESGGSEGKREKSSWSHDLKTSILSKILPFSSCMLESGEESNVTLLQLCLAERSVSGVQLLVEILSNHGKNLSSKCLDVLASNFGRILDVVVASNSSKKGQPLSDDKLHTLMSIMMQCMSRRSLWNKLEVKITRFFVHTVDPVKLGLILGPWFEVLKLAASSHGELVRVHLMHLLECLVLIVPTIFQCRRSLMVSEQLAIVICTLVQQKAVTEEMLVSALDSLEKDSGTRGYSKLAVSSTKLCLFQCCPKLISRILGIPGESPGATSENPMSFSYENQVQTLISRSASIVNQRSGNKRKCTDDAELALDTLERLGPVKRSKPSHIHMMSCAFELLSHSLDSLGSCDARRLDALLSNFSEDWYHQHYIAKILGKLPYDQSLRYEHKYFHRFLASERFLLVHLTMDALVEVTRKLHDQKQDYRYLVPKGIFDNTASGTKDPFLQCLSEHMKRPQNLKYKSKEVKRESPRKAREGKEWREGREGREVESPTGTVWPSCSWSRMPGNNKLDVKVFVEIGLKDALLGFSKVIKHLDGRPVKLTSSGVTQYGHVAVIKGEGMAKHGDATAKGDLFVEYRVRLPETVSQSQKRKVEDIF